MSDMVQWAKREIEIACKRERGDKDSYEWDYGIACYESAFKAFESLMEDGHSGQSISFTKSILNRLINGKPLTPIEDIPDIWRDVTYCRNEYNSYQCTRMSSLFKDVYNDGTVKYRGVIMDTMFENFDLWYDKDCEEDERPFMVACRDRETMDGERWVFASLSIEEAKKLHKYLEEHLHED